MAYIQTMSEAEATDKLAELYEANRKASGYVPNHAQAMSLNPGVIAAWRQLQTAIHAGMRLRRYELVTFAAALGLKCRY